MLFHAAVTVICFLFSSLLDYANTSGVTVAKITRIISKQCCLYHHPNLTAEDGFICHLNLSVKILYCFIGLGICHVAAEFSLL